ncbi:MAG: hypothetical protein ACRCX7_11480 [Cetobacterium sp.]|uniref:hypothetical protein n=1 Tax=Cetobacterium sp. TaxID=2071632 RepID=UPI003F35366F
MTKDEVFAIEYTEVELNTAKRMVEQKGCMSVGCSSCILERAHKELGLTSCGDICDILGVERGTHAGVSKAVEIILDNSMSFWRV